MPTLSELFNLDPNVERLSLLPRLRGSLPSEKSVMMPDRYMPDVIAPKILYDFIRAIKAPGRARRGEVLDEEEALNTALNMFGGGLATSGSVPIGALGMSARTAPAGTVPLREIQRSPLGFYSKVEEATLPLQNKGSGGQFLAQIQKTPGVKPEEIEVLGLDKFLQSKPTVTKQEVQDYITANKPDVQEVRLGGATSPYPYRTADEWQGAINRAEARGNWDEAANLNQAWEATEGFGGAGAPKFSKYTIPGGENYRELLLTLPRKTVQAEPLDISGFSVRTTEGTMLPYTGQRDIEVLDSAGNVVSRRSGFRGTDDEAIQNYAGTVTTQAQKADESLLNYRSSHFDQPNILTHLRANDRVIDGKKALFIEEIQSDWHQAGRKRGYKSEALGEKVSDADYRRAAELQRRRDVLGETLTAQESADFNDIMARHTRSVPAAQVPDAPFKKSWHELALKRAIQEAVDKGYDKLAFTTGKTQAERYDLSKQVNKLVWNEQTGTLAAQRAGGDTGTIKYENVTADKLSDYIGKEAADKLTKAKDLSGWKTIEGDDLRVGGEGMKGFYDEILPKALQNLTKKYGTKVTKTTMPGDYTRDANGIPSMRPEQVEVWSMDITPQMREQIKAKGQPLFATAPPLGLASQDPLEQFLQTDEARNDPLMQFLGYK